MVGAAQIFMLFFVTLGPLKLLGPFARETRDLSPAALRVIALRAFAVGLLAVLAGGYIGTLLAAKWRVSVPAMELTAGLILILVALQLVMAPYEPAPPPAQTLPATPMAAALRLTFPLLVTPYGIAALIALLSSAIEPRLIWATYGILIVVMLLDLLAMLFVREIMRGALLFVLQVLGAVLGVLQVGLGVQLIIRGLRALGALPG
jgi:multiple antibiotic resistance protein